MCVYVCVCVCVCVCVGGGGLVVKNKLQWLGIFKSETTFEKKLLVDIDLQNPMKLLSGIK